MTEADLETLRDAVARTVMEWRLESVSWAYSGVAALWQDGTGVPMLTRHSWRPDCDDVQNMRVLDRMTALGYDYTFRMVGSCTFAEFIGPERSGRAEGADRRLTVLQAALAALG